VFKELGGSWRTSRADYQKRPSRRWASLAPEVRFDHPAEHLGPEIVGVIEDEHEAEAAGVGGG